MSEQRLLRPQVQGLAVRLVANRWRRVCAVLWSDSASAWCLVILTGLSETAWMAPTLKAVEDCPIARAAGEGLATETVTAIRFCVCTSSDDLSEPFALAAEYLHRHPQVTVVTTSWTEGPCDSGQGCHLTLELIVRELNEPDIQASELEDVEAHSARGQIDAAATANGWSETLPGSTGERFYHRAGVHILVSYTPAGVVRQANRGLEGNGRVLPGGPNRLSREDHDKAATVLRWIRERPVAGP